MPIIVHDVIVIVILISIIIVNVLVSILFSCCFFFLEFTSSNYFLCVIVQDSVYDWIQFMTIGSLLLATFVATFPMALFLLQFNSKLEGPLLTSNHLNASAHLTWHKVSKMHEQFILIFENTRSIKCCCYHLRTTAGTLRKNMENSRNSSK